ncbi:hypothetical protein NE684_09030 [Pseudoflavonifractor phocaeensis]|nr:hypothetical protein [Pseudoflavonifractor phocaeensis]
MKSASSPRAWKASVAAPAPPRVSRAHTATVAMKRAALRRKTRPH